MAKTVADLLVERLIDWGVDTIFGYPGEGINGVFEALRTNQEKLKFIQVRHEESAAFAAVGYAKYTGRLGVCVATSGPGGIHLLNGLYDAKCDGQPVLAITGHTFHDLIGTHYQQDVDLDKLFMDVAVYNQRIMGPGHVYNVLDEAIKTALARRSVAHITIPKDIQDWTISDAERSDANIPKHSADLSDDLEGLRLLRDRGPGGMDIATGEYDYDLIYFRRMLEAGAVDVLQADASRCAGITGFLQAAALCEANSIPLSAHFAPSLHAHPSCAVTPARHVEYFHDHVRIEHMLFDGTLTPVGGELRPDLSWPGMGIELKRSDAARFAV